MIFPTQSELRANYFADSIDRRVPKDSTQVGFRNCSSISMQIGKKSKKCQHRNGQHRNAAFQENMIITKKIVELYGKLVKEVATDY